MDRQKNYQKRATVERSNALNGTFICLLFAGHWLKNLGTEGMQLTEVCARHCCTHFCQAMPFPWV